MPFTFSHPAIILPFIKIRHAAMSMSALVIGSVTPDFEYLIRMKLDGRYGHSIEGMFLLDLPLACIIALTFHQIVKKPFIDNLPNYFYCRLISLRNFEFPSYLRKHFLFFLLWLLIGIASHIVWDSFTHTHSFFVDRIDFLSTPITIDGLRQVPLYRYIQHASTVIGGIFIIVLFHRLPKTEQKNSPSIKFWITLLLIGGAAFAARASFGFEYYGDIITVIISSGIIGLIGSGIFSHFISVGKNQG